MFRPQTLTRLQKLVRLAPAEVRQLSEDEVEAILPDAVFVLGQTDLPESRLRRAERLKAIFNVEGNFLPNVDYDYCFDHGIHVLNASPVFAQSVAEIGLCLALDCARGVTRGDRLFREGCEKYGLAGNADSFLMQGATIGLVGYGDLGLALHRLLRPFADRVLVYDPWLPDAVIRKHGASPASLEQVLSESKVVFVVAGATAENEGFIDQRCFDLMQDNSVFVLLSRAAVVDFDALTAQAQRGRLRIATDVYPTEPLAADHPIRGAEHAVLSAHRAGGLSAAFLEMGELVTDDIELMLRGLPPRRCKRAERETVSRMRSRPVSKS